MNSLEFLEINITRFNNQQLLLGSNQIIILALNKTPYGHKEYTLKISVVDLKEICTDNLYTMCCCIKLEDFNYDLNDKFTKIFTNLFKDINLKII